MKKREVVVSLILSIVTCGIYSLYWIAQLNDNANELAEKQGEMAGGLVVLLTIVTCGIYGYFWNYQMGKKVYEIQLKNGATASDNSILYLVLALVGLPIVNYCLIQNDLNNFIKEGV